VSFHSLLDWLKPHPNRKLARRVTPRPGTCRLGVEALEDRCTPTAMLAIGNVTVPEGNAGTHNASVMVSLSEPHLKSVTVNYNTVDWTASADRDYVAVSGTLTFAKNEMNKSILVPVIGDRVPEPDKSFLVRLSNSKGARIANGEGIVTIVDSSPRITIGGAYNNWGPTTTFTVSLSAAYDQNVTVTFATVDGTAIAGVDYVAQAGTLTFAPGETTKTISVQVFNPWAPQDQYFSVHLSGISTNAVISNEWGTGFWGFYDPPYTDLSGDPYGGAGELYIA
jgi:hypothetical protein